MLTVKRIDEMAMAVATKLANGDVSIYSGEPKPTQVFTYSFLTARPVRARMSLVLTEETIHFSINLLGAGGGGFVTTLIRAITDESTLQQYFDFAQNRFEGHLHSAELYDN